MVYHRNLKAVFFGDGFNWLPFQRQIDSLALELETPVTLVLQDLIQSQITYFDGELYNIGTMFTSDIPGQTVTFNNDGGAWFNIHWTGQSDTGNLTLLLEGLLNGVQVYSQEVFMDQRNVPYLFSNTLPLDVLTNDVLTLVVTPDRDADLIISGVAMGVQKVV